MPIPVFAIVGRSNVGKSTFFNRLTRSRAALVADTPGVTRDRIYGTGHFAEQAFVLIDTGGIDGGETGIDGVMAAQTQAAIAEADAVFFLVDAKQGMVVGDQQMTDLLRQQGKKVYLLANKTDGLEADLAIAEFYQLALGEPIAIAAAHNRGIRRFISQVFADWQDDVTVEPVVSEKNTGIKLTVVGKPNVGKSTLINRLLGEERVVVYDQPGTTRDAIAIDMQREGEHYTLVDTAGVRRRTKISEVVEKFSVVKTLRAIEESDVVVFLLDATESVSEQDLSLISFVLQAGKAMVLAINKWDGMSREKREAVRSDLSRKLAFLDFVEQRFISAKHGTGVGHLFEHVQRAYASATKKLATPLLTKLLQQAVQAHPPPLVRGRRIKLRYAHAGGSLPPRIIIHGNQTQEIEPSYRRYLSNFFREKCKLVGTPLFIEFKTGDNPYEGRKNPLTKRQLKKRRRLKKFVKKNSS